MRTVKDFVNQLLSEGKSPEHIRAVATSSQFKNRMDEVEELLKGRRKSRRLRIKRKIN